LAADHPARWVDDLVEHGLDLSAITPTTPRCGALRLMSRG
jgi:hypothetical protein